jgi:hypothetical protein
MSEVHTYLIRFGARTSSFFIDLFPLFAFPSAGAVDKLLLPVGMQAVNFEDCFGLTGTAEA